MKIIIPVYTSAHSGRYDIKRKKWSDGFKYIGSAILDSENSTLEIHNLLDECVKNENL